MSETSTTPALTIEGVSKAFPGVKAVREASLRCMPGEVHALVGENGAGKSTLIAIASGNLAPDAGEVAIGGETLGESRPGRARGLGLSVVYQDDSLVPDLTVAQNVALGVPAGERPSPVRLAGWAEEQLSVLDSRIDVDAYVRDLAVGPRHLVELVKALASDPEVLLLDEPTAPFTSEEVETLFRLVRERVARGCSVLYVTHRLNEVFELSNCVSVMRDGALVEHRLPTEEVDEPGLVQLMVGRALESVFPQKGEARANSDSARLQVEELANETLGGVSLAVGAGEIVGFAGIQGNGQREAARALVGLDSRTGEVRVDGDPIPAGDVAAARHAGIEYLSSERREEALFMGLSVRENIVLGDPGGVASKGWISPRREREAVVAQAELLDIRTPSAEQTVSLLSGGNQQKVSLGRAFLCAPDVYVVDEPTQGVDAGARLEIYEKLRGVAANGASIIVVSSDAVELAGLCDRVFVFSRGEVTDHLRGPDVTEESIVGAAVRARGTRADRDEAASASWFSRFRSSDATPVALLVLTIAMLMAAFAVARPLFLSEANVTNLLFLIVPLGFMALGQAAAMLIGGIDLSVGPLVALTTVALAQIMNEAGGTPTDLLAIGTALAIGIAVGVTNGFLIRRLNLVPLIATLATYILLQGVALLWSPVTGGYVSDGFLTSAGLLVGPLPWAFLALVGLGIGLEYMYRRTSWGLALRSVGSRERAAVRSGIPVGWVHYGAYAAAGLLAAVGGIFFTATIGIGDPALGITFTLASITAVVLGGLSTWGGRGSFIGPLLGAVLLSVVANGFGFLGLAPHLQLLTQGVLILVAIALYSRMRAVGSRRDDSIATQY